MLFGFRANPCVLSLLASRTIDKRLHRSEQIASPPALELLSRYSAYGHLPANQLVFAPAQSDSHAPMNFAAFLNLSLSASRRICSDIIPSLIRGHDGPRRLRRLPLSYGFGMLTSACHGCVVARGVLLPFPLSSCSHLLRVRVLRGRHSHNSLELGVPG